MNLILYLQILYEHIFIYDVAFFIHIYINLKVRNLLNAMFSICTFKIFIDIMRFYPTLTLFEVPVGSS